MGARRDVNVEREARRSLVVHNGMIANIALEQQLAGMGIPIHPIGDCLTPRTAEEAVLDGLKVARML